MEQRLVLGIKNCTSIYCQQGHRLFSGKWIRSCSRLDGALFEYPSVRNFISAMAMLSDSKLLIEDGKSIYHILDLKMGNVLASQKMRRNVSATKRFAVSYDKKSAYRIWLRGRTHELVVINLSDLSYRIFSYCASLSHVADLVYIEGAGLLVLESQTDEDGVCWNQVTSAQFEGEEVKTAPLYSWTGKRTAKFFDGRYVWESGYMIRDLHTGDSFSLLENSDFLPPEKHVSLAHTYYPDKNYLQIIDGTQNFFIDCGKRKIIARYLTNPQSGTFRGILSGDEFWISKPNGIFAIPFPMIENA